MSRDYVWPTSDPIIINNVMGSDISLLKEKFGALSQNNDIYSRICVGNSSVSLEPFRGCTLRCAYCMANNDLRGLHDSPTRENAIIRNPEKIFDADKLLDALINHPVFIKDKTVLGFCTGSTEVFLKDVGDNVWNAMEHMAKIGLKNPIWLVVKSFGENAYEKWYKRFEYLSSHDIRVIISITDAGLPVSVEPFQPQNRFEPFRGLSGAGVILSHHLRPILPGISTIDALTAALEKSKNIVSSVCLGGLRIDPGMKLFWKNDMRYDYIPGNQVKELDEKLAADVSEVVRKYNLPIFLHSSEMISHHLGIKDYNLYRYRTDNTNFLQLGADYDYIMNQTGNHDLSEILHDIALSIGLNVDFTVDSNGNVNITENLKYTELHALIQALGHSKLFQENIP